jgi:hypothetical protein
MINSLAPVCQQAKPTLESTVVVCTTALCCHHTTFSALTIARLRSHSRSRSPRRRPAIACVHWAQTIFKMRVKGRTGFISRQAIDAALPDPNGDITRELLDAALKAGVKMAFWSKTNDHSSSQETPSGPSRTPTSSGLSTRGTCVGPHHHHRRHRSGPHGTPRRARIWLRRLNPR